MYLKVKLNLKASLQVILNAKEYNAVQTFRSLKTCIMLSIVFIYYLEIICIKYRIVINLKVKLNLKAPRNINKVP